MNGLILETSLKISWALLALLHIMPAMTAFVPGLIERLYGISSDGDLGVMLLHRGALFLAVFVTTIYAIFDSGSRKLASIILLISIVGFLIIYVRNGMPSGGLRKIALADLIFLPPLIWVCFNAWRPLT